MYKIGDNVLIETPHGSLDTGVIAEINEIMATIDLNTTHRVFIGLEFVSPQKLTWDPSELLIDILDENHKLLEENESLKALLKGKL